MKNNLQFFHNQSGLECATSMTPSKHNTHYDPQSLIHHFVEALGSSVALGYITSNE
jgi:hypothetical protein